MTPTIHQLLKILCNCSDSFEGDKSVPNSLPLLLDLVLTPGLLSNAVKVHFYGLSCLRSMPLRGVVYANMHPVEMSVDSPGL